MENNKAWEGARMGREARRERFDLTRHRKASLKARQTQREARWGDRMRKPLSRRVGASFAGGLRDRIPRGWRMGMNPRMGPEQAGPEG